MTVPGRLASATLLCLGACIIPDRNIQFEGGAGNEGAVRILQAAPTPLQWSQWCLDRDVDVAVREDIPTGTASFCPNLDVAETRPGGLLRSELGSFCVCSEGERDARALDAWTIFAEDPDLNGDEAADTLYGVLLLDADPLESPEAAIAYENYLTGCAPGFEIPSRLVLSPEEQDDGSSLYPLRVEPPAARNEASQWAFEIDDNEEEGTVDLCNDNRGARLPPGLHNLQFMVTDRPFFELRGDEVNRLQCGVPDIGAGATYAVINYVFECLDGTLEENADQCECEEDSP